MVWKRPIAKYPLRHEIPIDIAYVRIHPRIVPDIEARDAALFSGYTWMEFTELPDYEQAACVAHYRRHNQVESVMQQEITDYTKRKHPS